MDDGLLVGEEENKRRRTGGAKSDAPPQQIWRFAVVVLHCSSRCWTTADIVRAVLTLKVSEIRFDTDSTDKIEGEKKNSLSPILLLSIQNIIVALGVCLHFIAVRTVFYVLSEEFCHFEWQLAIEGHYSWFNFSAAIPALSRYGYWLFGLIDNFL